MSAIPTAYNGIRMRSRLEATWAAFFDLLGWPWEYEPIDLKGYIPDFVLPFPYASLIVEVKGLLPSDDTTPHTVKIERSGWVGSSYLVSCAPSENDSGHFAPSVQIGLLGVPDTPGMGPDPDLWALGEIYKCGACLRMVPQYQVCSEPCPFCREGNLWSVPLDASRYPGNWHIPTSIPTDTGLIMSLWATAKNRTQWKGAHGA